MKRKIGIAAVVVAAISFILWTILVVTNSGFNPHGLGLNWFAIVVLFSWIISVPTAIVCLIGDVIKFIGKQFSSGYNSAKNTPSGPVKFCPKCGTRIDASAAFCPACGEKLN